MSIRTALLKLLTLLIVFCSTQVVQGLVDMKNSNFTRTWIDYKSNDSPLLRISRSYRSRTLFNGFFGFGWCSNYEDRLDLDLDNQRLTFKECGDGQEIVYKKGKNKAQNSSSVIESFYPLGGGIDKVTRVRAGYLRLLSNGDKQKFDLRGNLVRFEKRDGNYIMVQYDKKKCLDKVIDNQGNYLNFSCKKNKIEKIITYNGKKLTYRFHNFENLVFVKAGKKTFKYKYDKLHNMVEGTYPDGRGKTFFTTYNSKRDWITSFKDARGCVEKYNYRISRSSPHLRHSNTVRKYCKKKLVVTKNYDFWYKKRKDGEVYLDRMRVKVNGRLESDTFYHAKFGLPISIKKQGRNIYYTYFPNGLVNVKKEGNNEYHFRYAKVGQQIIRMDHFVLDKRGKKRKHYWVESRLVRGKKKAVFDSRGFHLNINHDKRERISRIQDQAKRVVYIDYDKGSLRPKILRRPGFGSVRISYRSNGEINNIESSSKGDNKLIVTTQIIQIFNQFLELTTYLDLEKIYI